jgi:hypothetical protein
VTLGLAGPALWSVAMLPVPPHASLGSALGMTAVAVAAVLLTRHRFDASLPAELTGVSRRRESAARPTPPRPTGTIAARAGTGRAFGGWFGHAHADR